MTTRLSSCARLGLARVVSTLVVCGGLPLLVHAVFAPASDPLDASPLSVCFFAADSGDQPALVNSATINDPDDSSDDDGDDDVPGGDAAISVDMHHQPIAIALAERIQLPVQVWRTRTVDGHALRGPPSVEDDDAADDDDDDGQDDDDPLKALRLSSAAATSSSSADPIASPLPARALSSLSRGHALRAPPVRVL